MSSEYFSSSVKEVAARGVEAELATVDGADELAAASDRGCRGLNHWVTERCLLFGMIDE
jgi:hypothetical protein